MADCSEGARSFMRNYVLAILFCMAAVSGAAQEVRLNVTQGDEALRDTLNQASLSLDLKRDGATAPQDYVAAARADYRRLLAGLYSEGYYGGTISILLDGIEASRLDPLVRRPSVATVEINVEPGPRFSFGQVSVAPLAPGTQMPEAFAAGGIARSQEIENAAASAITGWREAGRPLARTAGQSVIADHPNETLDVALSIAPGPVLTFGNITTTGTERIDPARVIEIAGIPQNAIFNLEAINRAEANLRRSGAFSSASVIEAETAEGETLPLTISVTEHRPRRIGAGVEYSSVTGLTLSGFWLHRNLLGGAERLRLHGEVTGLSGGTAGLDYTIGAAFLRPATFRSDTDFYADALFEQLDEPNYLHRDLSLEAGIIRRIRDDVIIEYGIGYNTGQVTDALGHRSYDLLYLNLSGQRDGRDDQIDPTRGYYGALELTPFAGISGVGSGLRVQFDGRLYRSFGTRDFVTLAYRGQFGSVIGANAADVPADYLFFSGGGGSVRGQPYQSLAIDLGGGNMIGGTSYFASQFETRIGVSEKIDLVGFYDFGMVSEDIHPFSDHRFHAGAGFGLRYDTGLGPLRFDIATPVSGNDAGNGIEIYLGIGQAF